MSQLGCEKVQTFAVPEGRATKRLSFKVYENGKRKAVISSNLLVLFGLDAGTNVVERSLGKNKGLVVEAVQDLFSEQPTKTKKIYQRTYKHRKNSPIEVLYEVGGQQILDESFPKGCTRFHVILEQGRMTLLPLTSHQEQAIMNATPESRHSIFAACTSGVDLVCAEEHGFQIHSVIEWRPIEKRDKERDLTETGALTVLRNLKNGIRNLFCEDIMEIDVGQLIEAVRQSPVTTFMASPQCDDFTFVKGQKLKEKHVEDLSTSEDMALDMLRVIEAIKAPVVTFEQVPGWYTSAAYRLLKTRLRRRGYTENLLIAEANRYGGLTGRKRGYAVFTCLPAPFAFEPEVGLSSAPIFPFVEEHLHECRNVSHAKSIQDGARIGRLRVIDESSTKSPTFLKSQPRQAKDSVVIAKDGEYYWPSENLQRKLMGVPERFVTDCVSRDIAAEIYGQGISGALHSMVMRCIKRHIDSYFGEQSAVA